MRAESVAWERAAEVHEAAEGWRRTGAIDEATERAIRDAYPDPCVTPSALWRVLTACVVAAVTFCVFGAFEAAFRPGVSGHQALLILLAAASLAVTETLETSPRFARRGAAGATSFMGVACLLVGFGLFLSETVHMRLDDVLDGMLVAGFVAWGVVCWRWGSPVFAALSAVSLFVFLGRVAHVRLLWVVAGAALATLAARRLDEPSWAPSHRRSAAVLVVAGVAAVYAAVNVYSLDEHLVENLGRLVRDRMTPSRGFLVLSALATATLPLAILIWGLRARRTFLIDTGIVLAALSLVTVRHYVHLAPLWVVLTLSGAALVVLALAVERALRQAPGGETAGFTADPLFSDERRQHALQIVPVVAAFTAAPGPAAADKGIGAGGRFGGGGADEKF
jgi:hypothetical protein